MKATLKVIFGIQFVCGVVHASPPEAVFLPIDNIFAVQTGFDANDTVEVAVQGHLPNTCYRLGKSTALIDEVNNQILVNVDGFLKKQGVCLEVSTPFLEVIQIGLLKAGNYNIQAAPSPEVTGALAIAPSSSDEQDDFLYAPVESVELSMDEALGGQTLHLKGTYPYVYRGCMRIAEIKSYMAAEDVLVVQPIAKIFAAKDCDSSKVDEYNRFVVEFPTDTPLTKGLVHVRTLNGRAVNRFINLSH